jgi:hypothetical protein
VVGILAVLPLASALVFHPLHTSFAQVSFDSRDRSVDVSVRVFVDDYTSAAEAWARANGVKSDQNAGYARASFILRDPTGMAITFQPCGEKRVGDLMWICLKGKAAGKPSSVISRIMFERFDDQVNIVQTSVDGRKANLLFTSDDKAKRIP